MNPDVNAGKRKKTLLSGIMGPPKTRWWPRIARPGRFSIRCACRRRSGRKTGSSTGFIGKIPFSRTWGRPVRWRRAMGGIGRGGCILSGRISTGRFTPGQTKANYEMALWYAVLKGPKQNRLLIKPLTKEDGALSIRVATSWNRARMHMSGYGSGSRGQKCRIRTCGRIE